MNPPLQIWVAYFLASEPLCSQRPLLATSYPHVQISRKADYILADHGTLRPFDAAGPPVMMVGQFRLYRERPDVPGPSYCTRARVQTVKAIGAQGELRPPARRPRRSAPRPSHRPLPPP